MPSLVPRRSDCFFLREILWRVRIFVEPALDITKRQLYVRIVHQRLCFVFSQLICGNYICSIQTNLNTVLETITFYSRQISVPNTACNFHSNCGAGPCWDQNVPLLFYCFELPLFSPNAIKIRVIFSCL